MEDIKIFTDKELLIQLRNQQQIKLLGATSDLSVLTYKNLLAKDNTIMAQVNKTKDSIGELAKSVATIDHMLSQVDPTTGNLKLDTKETPKIEVARK